MSEPDTIERSARGLGRTLIRAGRQLKRARTNFGTAHEPGQRLLTTLAASVLACLAVAVLMYRHDGVALIDHVEYPAMSARVSLLETNTGRDPDILIINIDEAALEDGDWPLADTDAMRGDEGAFSRQRYAWPWPRHVYNKLIRYCREGGARAVVFDLIFSETGPNTNQMMLYAPDGQPIFTFDQAGDDLFVMEATAREDVLLPLMLSGIPRETPERDRLLARYAGPVGGPEAERRRRLRAERFGPLRSADAPFPGLLDGWPAEFSDGRADPGVAEDLAEVRAMIAEDERMNESIRLRSLLPITEPERVQGVAGVGLVTAFPDVDGHIRRIDIVGEYDGRTYRSLPLETWRVYVLGRARDALHDGASAEFEADFPGLELRDGDLVVDGEMYALYGSLKDVPVVFESGSARYLGRRIPLDESGRMRLRYRNYIDYRDLPQYPKYQAEWDERYRTRRPDAVYPQLSATVVLRDWDLMRDNDRRREQNLPLHELEFQHPSELVRDKIVFVAGTASGLYDRHATPLGPTRPAPGCWPRPLTTSACSTTCISPRAGLRGCMCSGLRWCRWRV
jgi:hypothetical protein